MEVLVYAGQVCSHTVCSPLPSTGDLFTCSGRGASLAHCISQDLHMGKGIAAIFKKKFGGVGQLKAQSVYVCVCVCVCVCVFVYVCM